MHSHNSHFFLSLQLFLSFFFSSVYLRYSSIVFILPALPSHPSNVLSLSALSLSSALSAQRHNIRIIICRRGFLLIVFSSQHLVRKICILFLPFFLILLLLNIRHSLVLILLNIFVLLVSVSSALLQRPVRRNSVTCLPPPPV
ncbi:hypothetical protein E2C01_050527 [Portunus trituberculatus]|uniref:Uncharacterized protein n=1 Tax=Portunus trituberculatus TaxID=210409 RepID=A0A5B7GGM9_PORTR|nr:hypothetical protein [Portunus trituberculatus]